MGELTIRRNRGFAPVRQQETGRAEKQSGTSRSQGASKAAGSAPSEPLRQLVLTGASQAEHNVRASRRTLQTGETVLAEVQDKLGRMAELAREAAGGKSDRAGLQAELEKLRDEIDRIISTASSGDAPLFLDGDAAAGDLAEALLYAVVGGTSAGQEGTQALPDWLLRGMAQDGPTPEQILSALGLDKNAGVPEILEALASRPLEGSAAAARLAALYLGAVIAGTRDPQAALEGLRQLVEKVAAGTEPDEAVALLTDGTFSSFSDFQSQFTGGTAPGLEKFLANLLLSGGGDSLLPDAPLLPILTGIRGMDLELLMGLLTTTQSPEEPAAEIPAAPIPGTGPEGPAQGEAPATDGMDRTAVPEGAHEAGESLELGGVRVVGRDLSGVSLTAAGELRLDGTADVTVRGTGQEGRAVIAAGSGTVTLQGVRVPLLTVSSPSARVYSGEEAVLSEIRLRDGVTLTLAGGGPLRIGALRGGTSNTLRLAEGTAAVVGGEGKTPGVLTVPVVLEGPASLAAQASSVRSADGRSLEPFDIVWKTLLPGWSSLTALAVDGRQVKMALLGGSYPVLARLWLEKGDPSHGHPAHTLLFQGEDEFGQPKTRYAYLRWSQRTGSFQEIDEMYPNPFTITGGEAGVDWRYEEESHTLHILSSQVTAIAGGAGTDANQAPFSGRIALADAIGPMELTLGGVVCRVEAGRAFSLGRENEVTLLLQSGSSNLFESGAGCAGISLGEGTSLRIDCPDARSSGRNPDGTLTASGGDGGAGIGRDCDGGGDRSSHILICGGVVVASGTGGGAGIGAGKGGAMGPVTILGGTVTATGGGGGGAGIGGALGAPVGNISIRGGTISAAAVYHAAAIGAGIRGESGDILITGTARIAKATGGNPGADIGACLFGGCGEVLISGGADIGRAQLRTRPGVSLPTGEEDVTLPQFRLSTGVLGLDRLSLATRESARAAGAAIDADRRWVSRIQEAYGALYRQLEQSAGVRTGPVRSAAAAGTLLRDTRQSILLQSSQALYTHGKRAAEDVGDLLR